MNAQETKNKDSLNFDGRTPLMQRLKAKFLSMFFLKKVVWFIFRLVLLLGIAFVVLYPFFDKITHSFMAAEDFKDSTVNMIPKTFTLETYKTILIENDYVISFFTTFTLSFVLAIIQVLSCCLIAYGLAKFKFKGNNIVFILVILTMIIPHQTLSTSISLNFAHFDIYEPLGYLGKLGVIKWGYDFGLIGALSRIGILPAKFIDGITLTGTYWPMVLLSASGLAFKNGLYIFLLRQFFRGVPDELEESAYIDGSGTFRTFFRIIIPLSVPMLITVFLFAFCWQWTDSFYTSLFYNSGKIKLISKIVKVPSNLMKIVNDYPSGYRTAIINTCGILVILPLVILYAFCQRFLVQGIERSGLTAD